jgi:hypothetical protein
MRGATRNCRAPEKENPDGTGMSEGAPYPSGGCKEWRVRAITQLNCKSKSSPGKFVGNNLPTYVPQVSQFAPQMPIGLQGALHLSADT